MDDWEAGPGRAILKGLPESCSMQSKRLKGDFAVLQKSQMVFSAQSLQVVDPASARDGEAQRLAEVERVPGSGRRTSHG